MNAVLETIEHSAQRYRTVGDWFRGPKTNVLIVRSSRFSDWRYEFLIQLHELVEWALCEHGGVTQKQVDDFDMGYAGEYNEVGEDPAAPYHDAHMMAYAIEIVVAKALGVNWIAYCSEVDRLHAS